MSELDEFVSIIGDCAWAAGGSDAGSTRANNEDALLLDPARRLFVIADGMGGHAAGEQASALVIRELDRRLTADKLQAALAEGEEAVQALLTATFTETNAEILAFAEEHPDLAGLGATAVLGLLDGNNRLYVANIGDSRAYHLRGETATILTRDHSMAALLMEEQGLSADDVRGTKLRNHLTMVLGSEEELAPAYSTCQLQRGERVVLCTDGLWDMLQDDDIAQIVYYSATPREAVYSLIAAADTEGGLDNITAIVIFR